MLRLLVSPLRVPLVRAFLVIVVLVGALAFMAWLIATSWTDDSGYTTLAFLAVFAGAVVGSIVLWSGAAQANARRGRTLDGLLALSPSDFEVVVARILRRQGYRDVSVVGGSGDLMADIIARSRRGGHVVVQCKRKTPGQRVGSAEMQKFIGMISVHHEADEGIFVTTSEFTQPAIDLAERHGILLIDGDALVDVARGRRRVLVGDAA